MCPTEIYREVNDTVVQRESQLVVMSCPRQKWSPIRKLNDKLSGDKSQ